MGGLLLLTHFPSLHFHFSSQFHDKIDSTTESLERIVERLRQPPSISAEVEKIKEQISENKNVSMDLEKLQPVYETLKQRGEEMIARSEGADKDISAKGMSNRECPLIVEVNNALEYEETRKHLRASNYIIFLLEKQVSIV